MKKRLFAGLLALAMTVNLMSATAFATEQQEIPGEVQSVVECTGEEGCEANEHAETCKVAIAQAEAAKKEEQKLTLENDAAYVAKIGEQSYETLQKAIDAAGSETEIVFLADVTENVTITQKEGINLTIDGAGKTFTGIMTVFGDGRQSGAETLMIKNVKFQTVKDADSCILSPDRTVNNKYSYSHNVTVDSCVFIGNTETPQEAAAIRHQDGGDKNWTITNCTVDAKMHSLIQTNNVAEKLTIESCKVESKNGANLNSCTNVEITDCTFDVTGYAVRAGVNSGGNLGEAKTYVLKNNTLKSACDDGDAVIMLRASAVDMGLDMNNNVVSGTTHISGTTAATNITAINNEWSGGTPVVSGATFVASVGDDYYSTFKEAVDAATNDEAVKLLVDITGSGIVIDKDITIDFNEKTYTVESPTVGSIGTETLGFQILKENNVVFKNGSITAEADTAKMLIQNYADLTVTDMNLSGREGVTQYILSNNSGTVLINGKTDITAPTGAVAFDAYDYQVGGYSGVNVTVDTTGTITGMVEVGGKGTSPNPRLLIKNGKFISDKDGFVVTSGTLIIDNADVKAGIKNDDSWCAVWANGGEVIIKDGKFHTGKDGSGKGNDTVYTKNGGVVTIYGGTFSTEAIGTDFTPDQYSLLNKHDATGGAITVYGGTFVGFNPADNASEGANTNFVATGYEAVANGSNYIVGKHELKAAAESSASCSSTGIKAHYKCETCGKTYSDAAGTTEVAAVSLVISAKGHSYSTKSDSSSHWKQCSRCGAAKDKAGHSYTAGKCSCGYETKVEVYVPETTTPVPTTPAPETTTATQTTAQTTTTITKPTEETVAKPTETPVEEVVVDTKIVEEAATEEVKEAVKETVTVTEEKATVTTETIEKVIEKTEAGATVILPLTEAAEEGQAVKEAEVPVEALEKIVEEEAALTVEFEGVKVTFEAETIKAIAEQAQGSTIELRVVPIEHHELNEEQQATLEEHDVAVCVSAQIFSDGEYIGDFKGGKARIAIPFTPEEGKAAEHHKVYFVDDHGNMTLMPATYVDGHMVFETTHFSDFIIVYEETAAEEETETVVEDAEAEEAVVEEVQEEAGFPIIPIIVIVIVIIAAAAFFLTKKKNGKE